jgi:hypothetical protein
LAGTHQDERRKKRNTSALQKSDPAEPTALLQNYMPNRNSRKRMDTRFSKGGSHPASRIGVGREHPKVQMEHQRTSPFGMELARREE